MHEIINIDIIEDYIESLRSQKNLNKVVFTNGVFDLIHRGHVVYLEEAKNLGDCLVLGLNSDVSVKRLKGDERPYVSETDRAYILSRLEPVDIVCIFDEDTPLNLIKKVKPDVLVKGGDYKLNQIVGREFVEETGGEVTTIPIVSGRSTTNLIQSIKALQ
jgi:rfaE bifunctional protein nucleotidyltransferase chain/domain